MEVGVICGGKNGILSFGIDFNFYSGQASDCSNWYRCINGVYSFFVIIYSKLYRFYTCYAVPYASLV